MSMFHNFGFVQVPSVPIQPKTAEIPAKTHPKCIKNAHIGNHKLKNSRGRSPETPLTRGDIPPLVLSPTSAFGTCSDFRRTTFECVATGLQYSSSHCVWTPISFLCKNTTQMTCLMSINIAFKVSNSHIICTNLNIGCIV